MNYNILSIKYISRIINLTDRYFFSIFFCNKKIIEKIDEIIISFIRIFPTHDFGNRQFYKITNTGNDGPCPYYKIKNIIFEQKRN